MEAQPETLFLPALDRRDPSSLPSTLGAGRESFLALRPDPRGRFPRVRWLRDLAETRPLVGHFCLPDRILHRLERQDPLGLRLASSARVRSLVTMDVPVYAFMTAAQRDRARALHVHRWLRTVERAPRLGVEAIPMVKGLEAEAIDEQLDLAQEQGLRRVAFYARELLLERRTDILRRFVRGASRRKLGSILLGASSREAAQWGPTTLVSPRAYVLARRRRAVDARGRARVATWQYCRTARRILSPDHTASLCAHNYHALSAHLRQRSVRLEV